MQKVASRFLLPLELYLGLTMLSWGISAGLGAAALTEPLLAKMGGVLPWAVALCVLGALQFGAAALEWRLGRGWAACKVWKSAQARRWIAFFAVLIWAWLIKLLLEAPGTGPVPVLFMHAPVTVAMLVWVFVENYKVRLAADENIATSSLQFHR